MKGVRALFSTEDFRSRAVATAAAKPRMYSPIMAAARAPRNLPRIGVSGMNAAIIST